MVFWTLFLLTVSSVVEAFLSSREASREEDSSVLVYPHLMKTGGTSLSIILALTTRVVCGSRLSSEFRRDANCTDGAWYGNRRDQYEKFTLGLPVARPGHARCAFGHFSAARPELLARTVLDSFPTPRFLLLLRSPIHQRASYFAQGKGTSSTRNFSAWIRGSEYEARERGMQIKAYALLGAPDADALFEDARVAWIGVTHLWHESLCSLARDVLGPNSLLASSPDLWTVSSRLKRNQKAPFEAIVSPEDHAHLSLLESREIYFVNLVAARIRRRYAGLVVPACLVPAGAEENEKLTTDRRGRRL